MAFNTSFGAQSTSTPFGATSTPANKPLFGQSNFSFGTPAPAFNLGSTATTTSATGFSFSNTAPTNTTLGGFGGFGTPATTTASGFGTFGGFNTTTTTAAAPSFSFGGSTTTAAGTQPGLFSGFNQNQSTLLNSGFGGFGSSFGAKPLGTQPTSTFGGFGQSSGLGTFGQTQPQQQQQQQQHPLEAIYKSVFNCNIFNDERDKVLSCWNLLQAYWGVGKGFYDASQPPAEYTPENPLCRFKSVGYSRKISAEPKDGLVSLIIKKKESDIRNEEAQLMTSLNNIFNNNPSLIVSVESIKAMSDEKTQVTIYLQEKSANGVVKRVLNTDLANHLQSPSPHQALVNMAVEGVFPIQALDLDQVKDYLETPPAGIDPRLWKQAQLDNPDPNKLLPVPIIGFSDIRWRAKCQENETKVHTAVLDRIASDISELKRKNSETVSKVAEYKQRIMDLEHRVLKVLVKQEATRNIGIALRPEEEALRGQLEALHSQVNTPAQFKGRLNELLSLMRMQRQESSQGPTERYSMNPDAQEEIHQFLVEQHYATQQVVQTVNNDMKDLKTMTEGLSALMRETSR